jgi:hypothetical protein
MLTYTEVQMSDTDQQIRERAYHLWEADGRPHGREEEYWERARELVGMEANPNAGQLPNPMNHTDRSGPEGEPIEEAAIMDNLGEFPGRFTDQGETRQTPAVRKRTPTERKRK